MKNIVILISGRGSNMQAIVQACHLEQWNARIAAVISNNPQAGGLAWAKEQGIDVQTLDHRTFESREAFDLALASVIDQFRPDLVILAGFMRILTAEFVQHYEGKMVNIHPSLLPLFPGLHTHQRALEAGHSRAGSTVHLVTAELDHGPILGQVEVPICDGDTADVLAARVLIKEHELYPKVIKELLASMDG